MHTHHVRVSISLWCRAGQGIKSPEDPFKKKNMISAHTTRCEEIIYYDQQTMTKLLMNQTLKYQEKIDKTVVCLE